MHLLIHFILVFIVLQVYDGHSNFLLNLSSSTDSELLDAMGLDIASFDFKFPIDNFFLSDYEAIVSCLYFRILVAIC
jgi:hypothetical protein